MGGNENGAPYNGEQFPLQTCCCGDGACYEKRKVYETRIKEPLLAGYARAQG